jgi:FAD/FMN-containing dehydrogenase
MAQGGGHGYSATLGVIQHAIMIRLEKFVYATFEKRSQIVRVGGGASFGDLVPVLHATGQVLR